MTRYFVAPLRQVSASTEISFLSEIKFHGVPIKKTDLVLLDAGVWIVLRVLRADALHYLMLRSVADRPHADEHGAHYVDVEPCVHDTSVRILSVTGDCTVTGLWSIRSGSRVYVVPKH